MNPFIYSHVVRIMFVNVVLQKLQDAHNVILHPTFVKFQLQIQLQIRVRVRVNIRVIIRVIMGT